jgi:DNA-binding cell septation regulator SpoVG
MSATTVTATRPTPIEVLELRRLAGDRNLKAFAKVRLGAVVIHGIKVVQQPGQKAWIALPQTPGRQKADGTGAGWFPVVEITSKDLMARVRDAVLEAWSAGR